MSFLTHLMGAGGASGAAVAPSNPMASGLGHVLGVEGSRVSDIAGRIGTGMNQVATAGGAQPGYAVPAAPQGDPTNHLQLLDPAVLQALVQRFRPPALGHKQMEQF